MYVNVHAGHSNKTSAHNFIGQPFKNKMSKQMFDFRGRA
jgi:hypothetical protein